MPEYTWDDIIINPNTEEAKNCIGKEVYYSDNPNGCLSYANNSNDNFCGIIREIKTGVRSPFVIEGGGINWTCIIRKKKEPKSEWIPFKYAVEFLDAYEDANYSITNGTIENRLLNYGGIWLINNVNFASYMMVTEVWDDGLTMGSDPEVVLWEELLRDYTFLNGTPCGKIKEEKSE